MATFIRSPCEKPCVRRSAMAASPSVVDQRVDARLERGAGQTVQRAVVADVLARGEARIQAARIGQHADALAHRVAVAQDVEAADAGACRRRASQRREHAQQRRLAGAVRAEQAGDLAVGRGERDVAHRVHFAASCRTPSSDPSTRIMAAAARRFGPQRRRRALLEMRRRTSAGSFVDVRASSTNAAMRRGPQRVRGHDVAVAAARRCAGCSAEPSRPRRRTPAA